MDGHEVPDQWVVLRETPHEPDEEHASFWSTWEPTGEIFVGDMQALTAHLQQLEGTDGGCFAAEAFKTTSEATPGSRIGC